jgi:hypothetical protein
MRRPKEDSLAGWTGAAIQDVAESVGQLADNLGKINDNPDWGEQVVTGYVRIFSLRRWSFLLPGGGALRGGPPPPYILEAAERLKAKKAEAEAAKAAKPNPANLKKAAPPPPAGANQPEAKPNKKDQKK